jgi:hypothetical protein
MTLVAFIDNCFSTLDSLTRSEAVHIVSKISTRFGYRLDVEDILSMFNSCLLQKQMEHKKAFKMRRKFLSGL